MLPYERRARRIDPIARAHDEARDELAWIALLIQSPHTDAETRQWCKDNVHRYIENEAHHRAELDEAIDRPF